MFVKSIKPFSVFGIKLYIINPYICFSLNTFSWNLKQLIPKHYIKIFIMMHFKNTKLLLLIFIASFAVSCTKTVYTNLWQTKTVKVDGNATDWETPLRYFDRDSKLQYNITNDNSNLYVCIRATELPCQRKIIRSGLQLRIDTTGRDKNQLSLFFPLANNDRPKPPSQKEGMQFDLKKGPFQDPEVKMLKNSFEKEAKKMQLTGFFPPIGGILLQNEYGILTGINWDTNDIMTYEAVIPFKTFYKESLSFSDSTKVFGISIVIPAILAPKMPGSKENGGGQGHGGEMSGGNFGKGGMRGGIGMQGGGGRGGNRNNAENSLVESGSSVSMFEPNIIRMYLRLATRPNSK
jgi:hypothetical protein